MSKAPTVTTLSAVDSTQRPYVVEVHFEQDSEYRILYYGFGRPNRADLFRAVVAQSKWNVTTRLHQYIAGEWEEVEHFE